MFRYTRNYLRKIIGSGLLVLLVMAFSLSFIQDGHSHVADNLDHHASHGHDHDIDAQMDFDISGANDDHSGVSDVNHFGSGEHNPVFLSLLSPEIDLFCNELCQKFIYYSAIKQAAAARMERPPRFVAIF